MNAKTTEMILAISIIIPIVIWTLVLNIFIYPLN